MSDLNMTTTLKNILHVHRHKISYQLELQKIENETFPHSSQTKNTFWLHDDNYVQLLNIQVLFPEQVINLNLMCQNPRPYFSVYKIHSLLIRLTAYLTVDSHKFSLAYPHTKCLLGCKL